VIERPAGALAARALPDRAWSLDSTPPTDYEPAHPIDYARASLTEIADHFKTDKGTIKHRYTEVYERYLAPLRARRGVRILEIGVACGASLKMWSRYFRDAQVVGVDLREACAGLCRGYDNISVRIGDGRAGRQPESFDAIVDDGSHISADIVEIFRANWPALLPGGLYFIEDLRCTHDERFVRWAAASGELDPARFSRRHFVDLVEEKLAEMDWRRGDVEYLHFYPELVVIRRAQAREGGA
jgi:precorrin-6B methylase 2